MVSFFKLMVEKNMKISRLSLIVVLFLGFGVLNGCSHFKSGSGSDDGSQTSGLNDQDGFGDNGISPANRLKAPYNQSYYFDYDNFEVKKTDVESVNVQANYLIAHSKAKVRLEGNTDERGSREYNVALGWKRAKAVAGLLKQQGVGDAQIAIVSFGKEKPTALGHDESSYSQNRRVDLIYESK